MAMGLFRQGDNSCDIDQNSAIGARGNEEEQQVQDGGHGVSDGAHEKTDSRWRTLRAGLWRGTP